MNESNFLFFPRETKSIFYRVQTLNLKIILQRALLLLIKLEFILFECLLSCERFPSCHKPFNPPFSRVEAEEGKYVVLFQLSQPVKEGREDFEHSVQKTTIGVRLEVQRNFFVCCKVYTLPSS